jgi:cell division protein FtsN
MSNQQNDLDPNENFDTDLGFDENQEGQTRKNNPLIKIGLIAGALVMVFVGIMFFGGSKTDQQIKSAVSSAPSDPNALPAQQEPTPQYREALVDYNQQLVDKANETGASNIPIPIDPARKQIETQVQEQQEDPAERFRRIQEEYRTQQEVQVKQVNTQQAAADATAREQALQKMSQAMTQYLTGALGKREPKGAAEISVGYTFKDKVDANAAAGGGTGSAGVAGTTDPLKKPKQLIPATTIEYGQLLIEYGCQGSGACLACNR